MRKWLGIGMLSVTAAAAIGVGAYWLGARMQTARHDQGVEDVLVQNNKDDGNAEPSEVIEPLVVQGKQTPAPDDCQGEQGVEPVFGEESMLQRVVVEPGTQQPARPDLEPGDTARMPMADEEPSAGVSFFLDWTSIKATLSRLNVFKKIKKAAPAEESANKETTPPPEPTTEPPPADPVPLPDYHQQYPHCPYNGPCPSPYRWLPRD